MLGFVEVVRGEQHGRPAVAEPLDEFPRLPAGDRVEAGRRFVEEQQLRGADDAEAEVEATALAARQGADPRIGLLGRARPSRRRRRCDSPPSVARPVEPQRLAHGQLGLDRRGLEHDADAVTHLSTRRRRIEAEHRHVTGRRRAVPLEDLDRGRLAGTVVAQQAVHLALLHLERHAVDGCDRSVLLAKVVDDDGGHDALLSSG